jgi:hypothetical protein
VFFFYQLLLFFFPSLFFFPLSIAKKKSPPSHSSSNDDGEVSFQRSQWLSIDMPAIGKFICKRSSSFSWRSCSDGSISAADTSKMTAKLGGMTDFDLSGMKVVVKVKSNVELKGRINFFPWLDCRDCTTEVIWVFLLGFVARFQVCK